MNINEIQLITSGLTNNNFVTLKINITLFNDGSKKGFASYNKYVKKNVDEKYGVYIFFDPKKQTVIYIGMSGKLEKNSQPGKQTLVGRLTDATRKDKKATKKWVFEIMKKNKIEELLIYVFYANPNIPAAYIEALLLFAFFKKNNIIPSENSEF
jgi:hypothetical protein